MLATRIAALTIATGALVAAAGPAFASVEVNPNPVAPGATVSVDDGYGSLLCPSTDKSAVATSNGFAGGKINLTRGTHALVGTGTAVTAPGTYQVAITCASATSSGPGTYNLVVAANGGAKTGDGASLLGSGTSEGAGIALLAGALGVGALALRRKAKTER
jgi:hypothetical protein